MVLDRYYNVPSNAVLMRSVLSVVMVVEFLGELLFRKISDLSATEAAGVNQIRL